MKDSSFFHSYCIIMAAMASVAQNALTIQLHAIHSTQPRYYTQPHSTWSHYSSTHSSSNPQPYNSESKECPFGNDVDCGCPFRHSKDIDEYIIPRTPRKQQTHQSVNSTSFSVVNSKGLSTVRKPKVILTIPPISQKSTLKNCWCFGI